MKRWIVMEIGCIECGVESTLAGKFSSEQRAHEVAEDLDEKYNFRNGGQNSFEVFEIPRALDVVSHDYGAGEDDDEASV